MSVTAGNRDSKGQAMLALAEATDPARCGHKAAALAAQRRSGHQVPDGFVIPVGMACSAEDVRGALQRLGPGPWAVRSSGVAEDLEDASFAGQYVSVLGLRTLEDVVAAVEEVRDSVSAGHVAAYRDGRATTPDGGIAVLVQRMVDARAAGVAFSANPVTGEDEVVIEAVRGLGDRLAAGSEDCDRWVDVWASARPVTDTGVIDRSVAGRVAALARRVARERGAPQDIEWALESDEVFLLQARPITGLPRPPVIEVPPGRWVKDTVHWSGPMTPAGASILLPVAESSFTKMSAEFGLPLETLRFRSFGGEVYSQEIEPGGKHNPGSPPPWWAGALAFRLLPPLRRIARAASEAMPKLEAYPRAWEESWREACTRRIDKARAADLAGLNEEDLLGHLHHLIHELLAPHMLIHFQLMLPDMVALHELAVCCKERLGWDTAQVLELVAGLSTTATLPAAQLAEIAARVDDATVARGLDAVRATSAGPLLEAWLALWGLRSIDLDPGSPTVAEHDHLVLGLLRQPRPARGQRTASREAAVARARAALQGDDRTRFDAALSAAERAHPQREDNVLYTQSLPLGLVRRALLEIGRRLVAAGTLRTPDDAAYLELEELRPALDHTLTGETASRRVHRRRAEATWVRAHPGPAFHGPAPVPPPSTRGLPFALRRLLEALLWEVALEETKVVPASRERALAGVGASAGRYTGRVRVIRGEAELSRLEAGEVLVCPTTHSSWALAFARAGALVTDYGGMLSHPAIVAREYDIPAVVATGSATSTLVDGQSVTVDGSTGLVELAR